MLLAAGSDVRAGRNSDMKLLSKAAKKGNYEIVRMLIEHHAALPADDPLLHMAITGRNTEIVKLLIAHGASTTLHHRGISPLFHAIQTGLKDTTVLLIEHGPPGATPGANRHGGTTPLHLAL